MRKVERIGWNITQIAEELHNSGIEPTYAIIREKLGGRGSYSTIHHHLKKWKERKSTPSSVASTILTSTEFQSFISNNLEKQFAPYRDYFLNRIENLEKTISSKDLEIAVLDSEKSHLANQNNLLTEQLKKREGQLRQCVMRLQQLTSAQNKN